MLIKTYRKSDLSPEPEIYPRTVKLVDSTYIDSILKDQILFSILLSFGSGFLGAYLTDTKNTIYLVISFIFFSLIAYLVYDMYTLKKGMFSKKINE